MPSLQIIISMRCHRGEPEIASISTIFLTVTSSFIFCWLFAEKYNLEHYVVRDRVKELYPVEFKFEGDFNQKLAEIFKVEKI
jgi:hypothetical protein